MKRLCTLCLSGLAMALATAAQTPVSPMPPASPWTAACDAPESTTVLWPPPEATAPGHATEAHAVWLNRRLLRWPGARAEGRFRLHHSLRGQLLAMPGERVRGADGALVLHLHGDPIPAAVAERHVRLGAGPTLVLSGADAAWLPSLLRAQVLLVQEDEQGRVQRSTPLKMAGALDDLYASAGELTDLGVTVVAGRTAFRLWAPSAQRASLCLYPGGSQPANTRIPLQRDASTGAWALQIGGDLSGRYYSYMVEVAVPGRGVLRHRVTDPYAIGLNTDARRSYIASLDAAALKPPGWDASAVPEPAVAATDRVVYGLPVRDFSINGLTVSAAHRGQDGAFTEAASDGMKHLRQLADAGLNEVHLLPMSDTAASDDERRIVELRKMVMALHGIGLRVSMGSACKHSPASGADHSSVLDRVVPGYPHGLNAGGAAESSTCGGHRVTDPLMVAKLKADTVLRRASAHHIESFGDDAPGGQPCGATHERRNGPDQAARQSYINGLPVVDMNAPGAGRSPAEDLLRTADRVRAGMAAGLRSYVMTTWRDELLPLASIDYAGQPAGAAEQPGEVVNHVERFDNPAPLDARGDKLPVAISPEEQARSQHLHAAIVAFSQGMAYFPGGQALAPGVAENLWVRDAFADLLKIRASSSLFRLRTAAEVQARLSFYNTGSVQLPTVLVGHLDGVGQPGSVFRDIVYLVNVDKVAQTVTVEPLKDRPLVLHPVHRAVGAADRRAAAATFDKTSGTFSVPARTAMVFVAD